MLVFNKELAKYVTKCTKEMSLWIKWFFMCPLIHFVTSTNILVYVNKGEFLKSTRRIMTGFTSDKDLSTFSICHIFPPNKIYDVLGDIFLDEIGILKTLHSVDLEKLKEFKTDIFKVHTDAGYLKQADMATRTKFYSLNTNFQNQLQNIIADLEGAFRIAQDDYLRKINIINSLFYNAPANLRVAEKCINDDSYLEDPNLKQYNEKLPEKYSDITEHSNFLSGKYSLPIVKDSSGFIRTTDQRKRCLKKKIPDDLKENVKKIDVFQMYKKL